MNGRLTGGQYSLVRVALGAMLSVPFCLAAMGQEQAVAGSFAIQWLQPMIHIALEPVVAGIGLVASIMVLVGWQDRFAAWLLIFFLPWQHPLLPEMPVIGPLTALLVLHLLTPAAPYGSLAASGRVDPGGDWQQPRHIQVLGRWVLALLYAALSVALLAPLIAGDQQQIDAFTTAAEGPFGWFAKVREAVPVIDNFTTWMTCCLGLAYLPALCWRRSRNIAWITVLIWTTILGLAGLPVWGLVVFHFFVIDPELLPPDRESGQEIVFFDGFCGLCHRITRFAISEDPQGDLFRYAPLQGETLKEKLSASQRANLPDSVLVYRQSGELLEKSTAALWIAWRLGGLWRLLANCGRLFPRFFRDWIYDGIAAVRHKLFPKPEDTCPLMPKALRERLLP